MLHHNKPTWMWEEQTYFASLQALNAIFFHSNLIDNIKSCYKLICQNLATKYPEKGDSCYNVDF